MFNGARYLTKGISTQVDIRLQIFMWNLIDELIKDENMKVDYLQVFNIYKKGNKILIEHKQEVPEYRKIYELPNAGDIEVDDDIKIFVIDDGPYSTMLLSYEY